MSEHQGSPSPLAGERLGEGLSVRVGNQLHQSHQKPSKAIKKYLMNFGVVWRIWWRIITTKTIKDHQKASKKYLMNFVEVWRVWWRIVTTKAIKDHQKASKKYLMNFGVVWRIWWGIVTTKAIKEHQKPSTKYLMNFVEVWRVWWRIITTKAVKDQIIAPVRLRAKVHGNLCKKTFSVASWERGGSCPAYDRALMSCGISVGVALPRRGTFL